MINSDNLCMSCMKEIGNVETNPIIQYTNGDTAKAYYYLKKY